MKVTCTADIHAGRVTGKWSASKGTYVDWLASFRALSAVVDEAIHNGSKVLSVGGDLLDNGTPAAEVVAHVVSEFLRFIDATGGTVVVIPGNHELIKVHPGHADPTCLLSGIPGVIVVDRPEVVVVEGVQIAALPWPREDVDDSVDDVSAKLEGMVDQLADQWDPSVPGFLLGHVMVSDVGFHHDSVNGREPVVSYGKLNSGPWGSAVLGHVHNGQGEGKTVYVGSPVKFTLSDSDNVTECLVLDTDDGCSLDSAVHVGVDVRDVSKCDLTGLSASAVNRELARLLSDVGDLDKVTVVVDSSVKGAVKVPDLPDTVTFRLDPHVGSVPQVEGAVDMGIRDEDSQQDSLKKWLSGKGYSDNEVGDMMDVAREVLW